MDRNTAIGIGLIIVILVIFSLLMKPSKEELAERRRQDSIVQVEKLKEIELLKEQEAIEREEQLSTQKDTAIATTAAVAVSADSLNDTDLNKKYGVFADAAQGTQRFYILENDLMRVKVASRGGRVYAVELKDYKTHDGKPLILFDGDSTIFDLELYAGNREISTNNLYFESQDKTPVRKVKNNPKTLTMRLNAGEDQYIEYQYTVSPETYMLDFDMRFVNMQDVIQHTGSLPLHWQIYLPSLEKGRKNEDLYTTLYYKEYQQDVDKFRARSKKETNEVSIDGRMRWVSFKHQFFSSVIIADDYFNRGYMSYEKMPENTPYIRKFDARLDIPYDGISDAVQPMSFYFGPNHFQTLKKFNLGLEDQINLGGVIVRPIARILIIPVFNYLERFISNYGIIILLLTLFIKLILLPLTYRSFLSQAKMRVLKPEIDEISKKYPKGKEMEKQQATMGLYKKVGVNPMGGCLIMILQLPILYTMFRFFPTSIELRQESFLWAHDLSTYDAILEWEQYIPVVSKFYGNHISLFTILMTVTTILSTRLNSQTTASTSTMPGMKTMMYIMPVMFMFIFNNFSSGLTYYYFLANLITLGQNALFRQFIDEEALLKKLHSKKSKNGDKKKKTGFRARMEEMAKQRGYKLPKK